MTEEQLLPPVFISAVFLIAAYLKYKQKMADGVFSYMSVAALFLMVFFYDGISATTTRAIEVYALLQIPIVQIFFFVFLRFYRGKYKKAMMEGGFNYDD